MTEGTRFLRRTTETTLREIKIREGGMRARLAKSPLERGLSLVVARILSASFVSRDFRRERRYIGVRQGVLWQFMGSLR